MEFNLGARRNSIKKRADSWVLNCSPRHQSPRPAGLAPSGPHYLHPGIRGWGRHEVGGTDQGRKCLLGLKIVWEGTGNEKFGQGGNAF
jgi:hypothetical protein